MNTRSEHPLRKSFLLACAFLFIAKSASIAQREVRAASDLDAIGPTFEVASVRPANRDDGRHWFGMKLDPSGRYEASAVTLSDLVYAAYSSPSERFKVDTDHAAPKWVNSDNFDVEAKIDDRYMDGWSKLSDQQRTDLVRPMLRRLLVERFYLKVATESRMTPVYALVQAKGGAHVKEVAPPTPIDGDSTKVAERWMTDNPGKAFPGQLMCSGDVCTASALKISVALGQIAANSHADRMVIDQTGLHGTYDFSIPFPTEKEEFPMQEVENALGMKFEPRSMLIKTFVIQSAQKPSVD